MTRTVYLLDGYSLIYRSYFAFMGRHLTSPDGRNTSAVFGFFRSLLSFIDEYNPEYFAVLMDSRQPTFRHRRYPEYKATREKAPQELHDQVPVIEKILNALGLRTCVMDGFEADDLMATLARLSRRQGVHCGIITGDKDLMQLVDDHTRILKPDKNTYIELDSSGVLDKVGVRPDQIVDYLALTGDQADNVPGVKGIGPKTAAALLKQFETLEGIYDHLDACSAGQRKNLEEYKSDAFLSRELVLLRDDVPLELSLEDLRVGTLNRQAGARLLEKEGARSLAEKLTAPLGELFQEPLPKESDEGASVKPQIPERGVYHLVTTEEAFDRLLEDIRQAGTVVLDTETDSLDEMKASLVGVSLALSPDKGYYLPLSAPDISCLSGEIILGKLKKLLEDKALKVVGQNTKYDYKVLKRHGVVFHPFFDTMIAAWLLDSASGSYGMDNLALRIFNYHTIHYNEVVPKGSTMADVPVEKAGEYAAEDAYVTFRLFDYFRKQLKDEDLEDLFYGVEMPLVTILGDMELEGIRIDTKVLVDYGRELAEVIAGIEKEIYQLCGREFNINSTKQLQEVLFQERKLKPLKKTKTGYSTDIAVLQELASEDPVPARVLRHRTLTKLTSTYVDTLPALVDNNTGRLHTRFNQTGTATGRLSSRDPNLQNIPIREEEGRHIRRAFIPRDGGLFISADYSQIELVVLSHLSGDQELRKAFLQGADVHSQTAALIFDVPLEEVTADQRRIAKTINFGVMYGMSAFRLSAELGIPRGRAEDFIRAYYRRFKGIDEFKQKIIRRAEKEGYVTTLLGRRRPVSGINSRNRTEKAAAERVAVNTPIQGTAADLVKLAMMRTTERIRSEGLKTRLLLQVHDELIFECPREEREAAEKCIREEMERVYELSVPLRVNIETGVSWGEFH